jgi:hypothetical protein
MIQDIMQEYKEIMLKRESSPDMDRNYEIDKKMCSYANTEDRFKLNPIQMCCFLPTKSGNESNCHKCLVELFKYDVRVNTHNPITRWSPLHWCCQHGDLMSV